MTILNNWLSLRLSAEGKKWFCIQNGRGRGEREKWENNKKTKKKNNHSNMSFGVNMKFCL